MNNESPNPYASLDVAAPSGGFYVPRPDHIGVVRQVKIIAILQVVVSLLEMLMGGFLGGMGYFMGYSLTLQQKELPPGQEEVLAWMQVFYGIFGGVILLLGLLRLASGIVGFWYRGYWFTVFALFAGLVPLFTCYCGPTSIGLCIYGLIIYFNPAVVHAFKLAREGMNESEILAHFAQQSPLQTFPSPAPYFPQSPDASN